MLTETKSEWIRVPDKYIPKNIVEIEGKRYIAKKPFLKTIDQQGECVIGGFWEIKEDDV